MLEGTTFAGHGVLTLTVSDHYIHTEPTGQAEGLSPA